MMNSTEFLENKANNNYTVTLDEKTLAELLTYIINDITKLDERVRLCEHMLYLDDESFENLKGWTLWMNLF